MTRPIAIDLFAGAGGLTLGFEQAGFDVVAAVEIDPVHCAVHKYNFPDTTVICKSVAEVTGDEIRERAGIGDQDVAVVFGGAPCQGFSLIGKRALDDPRNELVQHFLRIVQEVKPRYFLFENVPGLTVGGHKSFLSELIAKMEESGYTVLKPYKVLNAKDFGVPQDRKRLLLVGAREGEALPVYPEPTHDGHSKNELGVLPRTPTVRDAIGDLPDADSFTQLLDSDTVKAKFGKASDYAKVLRGLSEDAGDYSYPRIFEPDTLTSSNRTVHTEKSIERFAATPQGKVEKVSRFLRLNPDGLCNTLRAGTGSERGAFSAARPIHPFNARCITVREAARLHSYPDWFRLHVTKWHGFRQVGNSVPPLLGRAMAGQIAEAMSYKPIKPAECLRPGDVSLLSLDMSGAVEHFDLENFVLPKRIREKANEAESCAT